MDATAVARDLLTPIPAHATTGLAVVSASDGALVCQGTFDWSIRSSRAA